MTPGAPLEIARELARSALNETGGYLHSFTHSFNPATGCAYARGTCGAYCYAREFAERRLGRGAWGRSLVVKENAPELLRRELERAARRDPGHPLHVSALSIFSASTTDPCAPPLLETYRACLKELAPFPIRRWVIQTRSPAVTRLRREIEALGERAVVSFTVETDDARFDRAVGAGSPPLSARRRAVEKLGSWDVKLHLAAAPLLPLVDPPAFAAWIASQARMATVDTLVSGDGAGGRRSARGRLVARLEAEGIDWRDESPALDLLALLRAEMGDGAGWSAEGFGRLAG